MAKKEQKKPVEDVEDVEAPLEELMVEDTAEAPEKGASVKAVAQQVWYGEIVDTMARVIWEGAPVQDLRNTIRRRLPQDSAVETALALKDLEKLKSATELVYQVAYEVWSSNQNR